MAPRAAVQLQSAPAATATRSRRRPRTLASSRGAAGRSSAGSCCRIDRSSPTARPHGLESQLVLHDPARVAVNRQRLALAAVAVQREYQAVRATAREADAPRPGLRKPWQPVAWRPQAQIGVDPFLDRLGRSLEPRDLRLRELLVREVDKRGAPRQRRRASANEAAAPAASPIAACTSASPTMRSNRRASICSGGTVRTYPERGRQ